MKIKKSKGFTLIELLVAMAIMAILGAILVTLLNGGNRFYNGVSKEYQGLSETRIAMAYITNKLRENDVKEGIQIKSDKTGFRVKDLSGNFNFQIYYEGNKLKEKQLNKEPVEIANIDSLTLEKTTENNLIIIVGYIDKNNNRATYEQILALKCAF